MNIEKILSSKKLSEINPESSLSQGISIVNDDTGNTEINNNAVNNSVDDGQGDGGGYERKSTAEKLGSILLAGKAFEDVIVGFPERSLWFLGLHHPFRKAVIYIIKSKYFERTVLFIILVNCIFLAMSSKQPGFDKTGIGKAVSVSENVFLIFFGVEMCLKIIGMGFVLEPGSYLRDGWNVLDFLVVVLGLLAFVPSFGSYTAIRTVRVLRPLRTITNVEGMRVLVTTLLRSFPMLLDVGVLCAFAFFIFGIVGIQMFSGQLRYRCAEPIISLSNGSLLDPFPQYHVPASEEEELCSIVKTDFISGFVYDNISDSYKPQFKDQAKFSSLGRSCPWKEGVEDPLYCHQFENPNFGFTSFDNILWAWLTIFQCISLEGWTDIMYFVQDAVNPWMWMYFVILIVFGSLFAVNLALAVLFLYFTKSEQQEEEDIRQLETQLSLQALQDQVQHELFDIPVEHKKNRINEFCFRLQAHPYFEGLTMALIVINTLVMASEYYGMKPWHTLLADIFNYILTSYFAGEMVIKLLGLGMKGYLKDTMNAFDGVVVICSIIEIMVELTVSTDVGGLSVLRSFRLMRVFKLARQWKQLNKIINTIFQSLSSIAYLSLILLLFVFIMALMGMQFFGYSFCFCDHVSSEDYDVIKYCPEGVDCPPHQYCYVRCTASELNQWISVEGSPYNNMAFCEQFNDNGETLFLAQVGRPEVSRHNFDNFFWSIVTIFQILTGENWNEVMYDGMRSTSPLASLYFVFLVIVGNYIILNLFLAILLDNFATGPDFNVAGSTTRDEMIAALSKQQNQAKKEKKSGQAESEGDQQIQAVNLKRPSLQELAYQQKLLQNSVRFEGVESVDVEMAHRSSDSSSFTRPQIRSLSVARMEFRSLKDVAQEQMPLVYRSLGIFDIDNPFRCWLAKFTSRKYFETSIIILIILSSITLALDSPDVDPNSTFKKVLIILDDIFVVVFALEAVIKIIVMGFVFHPNSYLRNPWNILDFIIVIIGIVLAIPSVNNDQLTSLRALRTLRALRPLRVASRNAGMKVVVNALFQAIPPIGNVLLVCLLFFLIFGILGINLLKGKFYSCRDISSGDRLDATYLLPSDQVIDKTWCDQGSHIVNTSHYHNTQNIPWTIHYEIQHAWKNKEVNFDNIFVAMLTLFEIATLEMWLDVMYDGVDSNAVNLQPIRDFNPLICLFFIVFVIVGSFFVLNLFVGVTIDKFNEMQLKQEGRNLFLTEEQQQWLSITKLLANTKSQKSHVAPKGSKFRLLVFKLVTSEKFDAFVIGLIVVNILFMAMQHADMNQAWELTLGWGNFLFVIFFTMEAAFKMYGLGPLQYFKDSWNLFDSIVVVFSIIGVIAENLSSRELPAINLLRVFRVARIFRLIPKAKGLRTLLQTLLYSLPALGNVGSVLFLFFFIFAIMGMNLFGTVKFGAHLNRQANFKNFPNALLVLFRMATGESWNGIMHDCMIQSQCIYITKNFINSQGIQIYNGTFYDGNDAPQNFFENQCSLHPLVAVIFFLIFVVLCAFLLLNLVIAVILDNFQTSTQTEEMVVGPGDLRQFQQAWSQIDPSATNFIHTVKLPALLEELDPPLGVKNIQNGRQNIQNIIMSVEIPNRNNQVHFLETLFALSGRVAGEELPQDEERKIYEKLAMRIPDDKDVPKYTAAHFHAALYVQAAIRGFLARYEMRNLINEFQVNMDEKSATGNVPGGSMRRSMAKHGYLVDEVSNSVRYSNSFTVKQLERQQSKYSSMRKDSMREQKSNDQ